MIYTTSFRLKQSEQEDFMAKHIKNEPTADVLMNSMRAMGYTFESAIADIVDNSISAKANKIEIKFPIDPVDVYVAICDNGMGMDLDELLDAMKYGSILKNLERPADDLGRFGLGLKAASLSQCRKLTVASKKRGKTCALIWDLDYINHKKGWFVQECLDEEIRDIKSIEHLDELENGTIVVWEKFDLIEKSSGSVYAELSKYKHDTAEYLSLIFHRFLNCEKVEIFVNKFQLEGLDPFLESHKKTNPRKAIRLPINDSLGHESEILVQPFVLPFQKDLSKGDIKKLGGITDYRTKQGFYIYRNERLIIWGTWFGKHRSELTKHARVKVDIPNTLDDIWSIDIKKQNAKIPNVIKKQLSRAVDEAMDLAVKAQTYRGRIEKVDEGIDYIWDRIKERDEFYIYRINKNSRIFDFIKDQVDDDTWSRLEMILEEIENAIPYQQIYVDKSQNIIFDEISNERVNDIKSKALMLLEIATKMGNLDRGGILNNIFSSEPFCKHPNLKKELESGV